MKYILYIFLIFSCTTSYCINLTLKYVQAERLYIFWNELGENQNAEVTFTSASLNTQASLGIVSNLVDGYQIKMRAQNAAGAEQDRKGQLWLNGENPGDNEAKFIWYDITANADNISNTIEKSLDWGPLNETRTVLTVKPEQNHMPLNRTKAHRLLLNITLSDPDVNKMTGTFQDTIIVDVEARA